MFLKRLKLTNYRKFSSEKNIVEFISSKIVLNQDNDDINDNFEENSVQNDCDEIDVASDTTLIIGKNNAGKTTIITALDNLINHNNAFGANDFNYRYLQEYLDCYDVCNPPLGAPYIEFVLTVGLEEDSNDRISNLIPFMLVEDIEDSELDICIRYEVEDFIYFQLEMKELFSEGKDENAFSKFLNLLHNTDYVLKYYDKNMSKIDVDFKLSNLMELQCIKANHLKNDHCDKYLGLLRNDGQHHDHYPNQNGQDLNKQIIDFCKEPKSVQEIMDEFYFDSRTSFRRKYLTPMLKNGVLKMTIPEKPSSKNQKYFS